MPNVTIEQVVDTVIKKREEKKADSFFADIFWDFKMSNEEAKKFLLPEDANGKESFLSKLEQLKNFSFMNILKPFFNTDLSKLKTYLEVNKDNAFALWKLKQQIEQQKKLNIELALQKAKNNTAQNVQSNPTQNAQSKPVQINSLQENTHYEYDDFSDNNYVWPYSLEWYQQRKTAQKLAKVVVENGPYKQSRKNNCGAGVRAILHHYMWFNGFPTSWANWETRDTILEQRYITTNNWKKVKFEKRKVKTPYEAKPWAIIPYEANAELWSPARKKYGHIEVKWSDWNYYFDRKGKSPWWSARVSFAEAQKMTAEEYRRKTWFQGYVYYPVIEWELDQVA